MAPHQHLCYGDFAQIPYFQKTLPVSLSPIGGLVKKSIIDEND